MRVRGTRKLPSIRRKNTRTETAVSQAASDSIAPKMGYAPGSSTCNVHMKQKLWQVGVQRARLQQSA